MTMSGIKRCLTTDDDDRSSPDKVSEENLSPLDSPQSKRYRRHSSHSDADPSTQIIDQDPNENNGCQTDQSDTEEEDINVNQENEPERNDDVARRIDLQFDNGENDKFRYDGTILFHLQMPTRHTLFRLHSQQIWIRTFTWEILVTTTGERAHLGRAPEEKFGVFIKPVPSKGLTGWSIYGRAEVTLLHPTDPKKNHVKTVHQTFSARASDWGYSDFIPIKDLYREYIHPSDRTVRLTAKIHADPPRNVEWNSKLQTGYVGLQNIGATCYMNSFLQTIYFTKKLRKAVYALPTDGDDLLHSMPLALQKVFYDLQFGEDVVNTKKLTRSFGWDKPEEFCQHDIQEFCRILLDKLESKMEGTTMEGIIPSLFQGQYVQYVRCTKVDYESRVEQSFYDVPLQVRNNANITDSFRDFCKTEILTGDNLYDAGSVHGLQEAEKGVQFLKLPPVLCLHLLRFEYDYQLSQHRKINDNYSFDYCLDLSEFLENPDGSSSSYKLLSILVHSGDNSSGHYVSYINPKLDGDWFKFDDEIVGRVAPTDAMERNFGGNRHEDFGTYNTSAYMLVYIREDCQDDVLCEIREEDIPENFIRRCRMEKKNKIYSNNQESIEVKVILNDDLSHSNVTCFADLLCSKTNALIKKIPPLRSVSSSKSELFHVFAQRLIRQMGLDDLNQIRLWVPNLHETPIAHAHHHFYPLTIHVPMLVQCDDLEKKMIDVFHRERADLYRYIIFVEQKRFLNGIYQLLPYNKEDDVLLFVRLFNPQYESLLYIGYFFFSKQQALQTCLNEIATQSRLATSSNSSFIVYQAMTRTNYTFAYEPIQSSNFDLPLSQALELCLSGSSLIIQLCDSTGETKPNESISTVQTYFANRVNQQEHDVFNEDNPRNEVLFKLYLTSKTPIREVIRLIAERIEYPPEQIIIQRSQPSLSGANGISSSSFFHLGSEQTLRGLYSNNREPISTPRRIYFKRLPFHYAELEQRRPFRISLMNSMRTGAKRDIQVYPKKSSTVAEFLSELPQWIPSMSTTVDHRSLRIIELTVHPHSTSPFKLKICPHDAKMGDLHCISSNQYFYLEETSIDDNDSQKESTLIPVAQYTKENNIQINMEKFYPFFLPIKHNETVEDVKQRLRHKLNLSNLEFGRYRFALCMAGKLTQRYDDNLVRINLRELIPHKDNCWLGLESPTVSNSRKTRKAVSSEKPIRIN